MVTVLGRRGYIRKEREEGEESNGGREREGNV